MTVKYLIDTNIMVYAAAGDKRAVAFLDQAQRSEWVGYSAMRFATVATTLAGARYFLVWRRDTSSPRRRLPARLK